MLSYQHIYHAGCPADVHKHSVMALLLTALVKDHGAALISYMDSHAGRGLYDLRAPEARKTGEAKSGVMKLAGQALPAPMMPYLRAITRRKGFYPGSALIAAAILGGQDRLHLCELHPREYEALAETMKDERRALLYHEDGYQRIRALAAETQGPGLVMIDPSFEIKDEYERAAAFVSEIHELWPEAVILLWLPLLPAGRHEEPLTALSTRYGPSLWQQDALFAAPGSVRGMYGSALAGLNIPAAVKDDLAVCGDWCAKHCRL